MSIKAVAFDYGGVLSFTPSRENEEKMERLSGLAAETLRELHGKYRGEFDRGTYDGEGYYRFILSAAGVSPDTVDLAELVRTDLDGWKRLNPHAAGPMRDVKAAGFITGILSNMPRDFLVWARQSPHLFDEAYPAVFSCEHHTVKPETANYEKLKELAGCAFSEIVFFDDTQDNITKARELGIHAFLWEGPEAARETLKKTVPGLEML